MKRKSTDREFLELLSRLSPEDVDLMLAVAGQMLADQKSGVPIAEATQRAAALKDRLIAEREAQRC